MAPVPEDIVSPTPRSKIRARMASPDSRRQNDTLVRLGNSSWCSIGGPSVLRSSSSRPSGTSIAHWGLPIDTCWKASSRPPDSSLPVPSCSPDGKSFERRLARPMSTVQVVGPVIRGRTSPAAVWIEKVSLSVQPLRRRYITASRTPLPDSSASEPSGLKIRSAATKPRSAGSDSSRMPSDRTPVWGSQSAWIRLGVSSKGRSRSSTISVVVAQGLPLLEPHGG